MLFKYNSNNQLTMVLPEESIIIPSALLFVPATIPGASDDGTFKLI